MSASSKKVEYQKTAKDEYRKILEFMKRADNKEPIDLKEMLKTYLHLFVIIKDSIEKGSESEKKESLLILSEFFDFFVRESKKIKDKTGLSDNEIFMVGENPNFFTPDQWRLIQEAKQEMSKMGLTLSDLLYKRAG